MRREAVHAGSFYPGDPGVLKRLVAEFVSGGQALAGVRGIVVPHAGYQYSGAVAGVAYGAAPENIKRVVLLGPSHHYPLEGIAVWNEGPWETPLGDVDIDPDAALSLLAFGAFRPDFSPHLPEHSLEVQLPFIKHRFPDARIVPCLVGAVDSQAVEEAAGALRELMDQKTLVVASSDLYHGYSYEECVEQDAKTLSYAAKLNGKGFALAVRNHEVMACGGYAISLLLEAVAGLSGSEVRVLRYTNSAEVTGSYSGYVVGYAALALIAE